eukprot:15477828-Alexandrium_andersonii.AAC.1
MGLGAWEGGQLKAEGKASAAAPRSDALAQRASARRIHTSPKHGARPPTSGRCTSLNFHWGSPASELGGK